MESDTDNKVFYLLNDYGLSAKDILRAVYINIFITPEIYKNISNYRIILYGITPNIELTKLARLHIHHGLYLTSTTTFEEFYNKIQIDFNCHRLNDQIFGPDYPVSWFDRNHIRNWYISEIYIEFFNKTKN